MRMTAHFAFFVCVCVRTFSPTHHFDCGQFLAVAISRGSFHGFEQTFDQLIGTSYKTGPFLYFEQPCSPRQDWKGQADSNSNYTTSRPVLREAMNPDKNNCSRSLLQLWQSVKRSNRVVLHLLSAVVGLLTAARSGVNISCCPPVSGQRRMDCWLIVLWKIYRSSL